MTADEVIGAQVAAPAARPWAGWTLVLLASVVLSTSPVVARGVMRSGMDPALLLMLRFWLATALLGALLALRAPALLRIDRYGLKKCMKAGLLAGLDTLAFFYALQRLDASLAVMLSSFYPLLVLLWLAGQCRAHLHCGTRCIQNWRRNCACFCRGRRGNWLRCMWVRHGWRVSGCCQFLE